MSTAGTGEPPGQEHLSALPTTRGIMLPRWKVLYVVTPKAACTSLLSMFAELQREPREAFRASLAPEVTRALAIHDFSCWQHTRTLRQLTEPEWRQIRDDPGWFVFCVTRHPLARLWSAWQSKLLLREPYYARRYAARPWFPRIPHRLDEVVEDFESFVDALQHETGLLDGNSHWRPQTTLLRPDAFPYRHIGKVEELQNTVDLLGDHLKRQGWTEPLTPPRENATPIPLPLAQLSRRVIQTVERLYARDLALLAYSPTPLPALPVPGAPCPGQCTDLLLRAARMITERNERLADVLALARGRRPAVETSGHQHRR
ncbi:sulfotransferase family 2 domain-containing protein [Streptomyces sp. ISL-11]|uniref:sulfotransferase family 2 domain-containing protein n=1 Tax=Streptomyces sp. ISL-11 TaxID=2819174 RepID=UPI001BEB46A0|nr:sulfotransferase family 2 domain-containing protein [Streptomyces sp. ISL-11]MBT2386362.1 sulfotransferase family 2 domain-containing protein [Streptomyces sp. ISL-11]